MANDHNIKCLDQGFLNFLSRAPLDTNPYNSRLFLDASRKKKQRSKTKKKKEKGERLKK